MINIRQYEKQSEQNHTFNLSIKCVPLKNELRLIAKEQPRHNSNTSGKKMNKKLETTHSMTYQVI